MSSRFVGVTWTHQSGGSLLQTFVGTEFPGCRLVRYRLHAPQVVGYAYWNQLGPVTEHVAVSCTTRWWSLP
jgi:hypothetical protein